LRSCSCNCFSASFSSLSRPSILVVGFIIFLFVFSNQMPFPRFTQAKLRPFNYSLLWSNGNLYPQNAFIISNLQVCLKPQYRPDWRLA
jgi:hypothetical protein